MAFATPTDDDYLCACVSIAVSSQLFSSWFWLLWSQHCCVVIAIVVAALLLVRFWSQRSCCWVGLVVVVVVVVLVVVVGVLVIVGAVVRAGQLQTWLLLDDWGQWLSRAFVVGCKSCVYGARSLAFLGRCGGIALLGEFYMLIGGRAPWRLLSKLRCTSYDELLCGSLRVTLTCAVASRVVVSWHCRHSASDMVSFVTSRLGLLRGCSCGEFSPRLLLLSLLVLVLSWPEVVAARRRVAAAACPPASTGAGATTATAPAMLRRVPPMRGAAGASKAGVSFRVSG